MLVCVLIGFVGFATFVFRMLVLSSYKVWEKGGVIVWVMVLKVLKVLNQPDNLK